MCEQHNINVVDTKHRLSASVLSASSGNHTRPDIIRMQEKASHGQSSLLDQLEETRDNKLRGSTGWKMKFHRFPG